MHVEDLMTRPAVTCRPNDTLNTAAQLMWEHDCGAVPVVDAEGRIVGMVTDRDICMAAYTQGSPLHVIAVANAMSKEAVTCHANETVEAAEQLMSERQIRRLPVVDKDNRPIGILSVNDLTRHAAGEKRKNGLSREVTQTLAAIGQPRLHIVSTTKKASRTTRPSMS